MKKRRKEEPYEQEWDFNWFYTHYEKLHEQYDDKYVAIRNKKVIGVYDTSRRCIMETMRTFPLGEFICMCCDMDKDKIVLGDYKYI